MENGEFGSTELLHFSFLILTIPPNLAYLPRKKPLQRFELYLGIPLASFP